MTKYLISFPSSAMVFPEENFQVVSHEAHAGASDPHAAGQAEHAGPGCTQG
jgi:hypothetical protein